jgi:hypothetical protein
MGQHNWQKELLRKGAYKVGLEVEYLAILLQMLINLAPLSQGIWSWMDAQSKGVLQKRGAGSCSMSHWQYGSSEPHITWNGRIGKC